MRAPVLRATCLLLALALAAPAHAATITIVNMDGAGEGFNDPTPAAPVGGNPGVTIGQQRLNVFQEAANIWGGLLTSNVTIFVQAQFNPLSCTSTSAVLGSAGPITVSRDFAGAPVAGHWYHAALANKLANVDLVPANNDINAQFNSSLGQVGCLDGRFFYYGYDGNEGNNIDLLAVVLHELGHGLGFSTTTSGSTGNYLSSFPSIFDQFLLDNVGGLHWDQMTAPQRQASAINNNGNLVWDGLATQNMAPSFLGPRNIMFVNSPPGIAGAYLAGAASFGPPLDLTGVTGDVVLANDGTGTTTDACEALINGAAINGNIALVDRGTCAFTIKVKNAQNAGAIGVIVADNVAGSPPGGLGGVDPTIIIPSVRITLADGTTLKANLPANATLRQDLGGLAGADNSGRPLMFSPNPFQGGSSISHWDISANPNLLMEPAINADLNSSPDPNEKVDLTKQLFMDIGWFPAGTAVENGRPGRGALSNAPNPFGPSTTIRFELARDEAVDLAVYDLNGRLVKQLVHGSLSQGPHAVPWNGYDSLGRPVASGVYLYRLKRQGSEESRHLVLYR